MKAASNYFAAIIAWITVLSICGPASASPIIDETFTFDEQSVYSVDITDLNGNYVETRNAINGFYTITLSTDPVDWGQPSGSASFPLAQAYFNWFPEVGPTPPPLHIFMSNFQPSLWQNYNSLGLPSQITFSGSLMITEPYDDFYVGGKLQAIFLYCGDISIPVITGSPYSSGSIDWTVCPDYAQTDLNIPMITKHIDIPPYNAVPVPEPSTLLLICGALPILIFSVRRRGRNRE